MTETELSQELWEAYNAPYNPKGTHAGKGVEWQRYCNVFDLMAEHAPTIRPLWFKRDWAIAKDKLQYDCNVTTLRPYVEAFLKKHFPKSNISYKDE